MKEEIGYAVGRLELLRTVSIAPAYIEHVTHILLARELREQSALGDEPEPIEVVPWPLAELDALLAREDFTDARSIAALLLVQRILAVESGNSSMDAGRADRVE
jgi:ADP-ribose diphosphatase